jgi:murein DD-endopeptidase MepM/ murein hydrolase activator NlpD
VRAIRAEGERRAALRALRIRASAAGARSADGHVFPIRGRHDRGRYETNDFGGGRGHQGQDMFAGCGTPLAAALGGRVLRAASEGAGGNYLVIHGRDGRDYVYMHMQQPPALRPGDRVETGERIGRVGDSGDADGCHLHFELWTAPGWYAGGHPVDTARMLAAWDAAT